MKHWLFRREVLTFLGIYLVISFGWSTIRGEVLDAGVIASNLIGALLAWVVYGFFLNRFQKR